MHAYPATIKKPTWNGKGKFLKCEVEVVIINSGDELKFEEELAKDVLEMITVFSARLYGSRSKKNQKLLDGMKQVVEDAGT